MYVEKKSKKSLKIADVVMMIAFLLSILYFLVEAILGGMIPYKYILIMGVILCLIAVILLLNLKFARKPFRYRRIVLCFLSLCLCGVSFFQGRIRRAFEGVNDGSEKVSMVYLMVGSDSVLTSPDEVKEISYLNGSEAQMDFVKSQLNDASSYTFTRLDDLNQLFDMAVAYDGVILLDELTYSSLKKDNQELFSTMKVLSTYEQVIKSNEAASDLDITKEPFTVFISGTDELGVPNQNSLSDVNILLMINPVDHSIGMASIPRDAYVLNPALDDMPDKLTQLGYFGMDSTVQGIEKAFDIEVDFYAKVSFTSLIEIVDTLGGIEVDVLLSFEEQDENRSFAASDMIYLDAGVQVLDGREALAYARHRHTEGWGDAGRNKAQQQIIKAIIKKLLTPEGVSKVADVMNVATQYVSTNMPMSLVKQFVNAQIEQLQPWSFRTITLDNGDLSAYYIASCSYEYFVSPQGYGGYLPSIYLLSDKDLAAVHGYYTSMFEKDSLSEFAFDLEDMAKYEDLGNRNPKMITLENIDQVDVLHPGLYAKFNP